jgi:peroxin-16
MAVKKEANKRTWYRDQTTTMTQVKDTLSPIARYESFLVHNSTMIGTIESSLRSLSWFLPGKFKDADLASESCEFTLATLASPGRPSSISPTVTTVLNLISFYHDTLLARRFVGDKFTPLIPLSDHSRYTRAWTEKRVPYKHVARALEIIRYIQLVIEMYLRRRGADHTAWRGILTLEAIKSVLIVCSKIATY